MNTEQQKIEYKSLQKIRTGEKGFKELSTTCVKGTERSVYKALCLNIG